MTSVPDVLYVQEQPSHETEIEAINAEAFGPGRYARAAYRIREGGPHDRELSFVALRHGGVVATCRLTPIAAGQGRGLLLGPLAVRPSHKDLGIGRRLVSISLEAAAKAGHGVVLLVGDEPYYGPFGFKRIPRGQMIMPRPVDPNRFLAHEIVAGALEIMRGDVVHAAMAAVALA